MSCDVVYLSEGVQSVTPPFQLEDVRADSQRRSLNPEVTADPAERTHNLTREPARKEKVDHSVLSLTWADPVSFGMLLSRMAREESDPPNESASARKDRRIDHSRVPLPEPFRRPRLLMVNHPPPQLVPHPPHKLAVHALVRRRDDSIVPPADPGKVPLLRVARAGPTVGVVHPPVKLGPDSLHRVRERLEGGQPSRLLKVSAADMNRDERRDPACGPEAEERDEVLVREALEVPREVDMLAGLQPALLFVGAQRLERGARRDGRRKDARGDEERIL